MSNTLLESLWARVDTNIGSRITKISELLTQSLSANDESKAARDAAAASATEAKNHADRAELATDVSGLRDEVTQQIAAVVDGAPAALDTIREVAEYAQANRGITDQLNAAIGDKANKSHTHTTSQVTGLDNALSGKAAKSHTHTTAHISDYPGHVVFIGSDSYGKIPVREPDSDNLRTGSSPTEPYHVTSKQYVDKEVAKKANASHTHTTSQISGLGTALNGKADKTHSHTTAEITDFSTEMGKKANTSHTHSQSDITGLSTALSGKANSSHTHTTADITNFATEMGKKADKTHTHTTSQISGLDAALDGKADKSYVDSRPAIFTVPDINSASTDNLVPGDVVVDTSTWIFYYLE